MLKISEERRVKSTITLLLEGSVAGPWATELSRICEPFLSSGLELVLDLADVSFADEGGVASLSRFKSRGAKLLNATPFLDEQLRAESAPPPEDPSENPPQSKSEVSRPTSPVA